MQDSVPAGQGKTLVTEAEAGGAPGVASLGVVKAASTLHRLEPDVGPGTNPAL